jgi:gamma-glutamylcyclotransferase (GGCT)/AIG2-like uncharacterized protein YtfP
MSQEHQYIAFYGTLMQDQHAAIREYLKDKLTPHGKCLIPGNIYDMGRHPALKLDEPRRSVHGEIYKIDDDKPLDLLDEYEAHDNYVPDLPGFTRRLVELDFPQQTAWVYEYDGPVSKDKLILSEDWRQIEVKTR